MSQMVGNGVAILILANTISHSATSIWKAHPRMARGPKITAFAVVSAATIWAIWQLGTNW